MVVRARGGCAGAVAFAALAGCAPPADPLAGLILVGADPPDAAIADLPAPWADRFAEGDVAFDAVYRDATGLGPAYVRQACTSCHADDARGPGVVEKFVRVEPDGVTPRADQSGLPWGHTARPHVAGGATTPLLPPSDLPDLLVTARLAPPVFARGYVEAVADEEMERVEAEQAAAGEVSGRVHRVAWQSAANPDARFHDHGPGDEGLVGRFGLKARIATLDEFVADALQGDLSITSPLRPDELPNPDGRADDLRPGVDVDLDTVNVVADYVRLLAIPARDDVPGADVFAEVGCAACHVPRLRTRDDHPVPALAGIDAPLYSDLLLHDLGAALADGMIEGDAGPSEWKTAPLVGVRHQRALLHDGRARDVEEAIVAHGEPDSEAAASVDAFLALPEAERAVLVRFVESL